MSGEGAGLTPEAPAGLTATPQESVVGAGEERITPGLLRKNLSVVSLMYLVSGITGFAAQAVLARHLGRATMGVFFAAFSLVTIVQVLDRLAREEYVVREGARDRGRLQTLVGDVLLLK